MVVDGLRKRNIQAKSDRLYRRHTVRKVYKALEYLTKQTRSLKLKHASIVNSINTRTIFESIMRWRIFTISSKTKKAKDLRAIRFNSNTLKMAAFQSICKYAGG